MGIKNVGLVWFPHMLQEGRLQEAVNDGIVQDNGWRFG